VYKEASIKDRLEHLVEDLLEHGIRYPEALAEFERQFIRSVLSGSNNNHSKAARVLGIHRNSLNRKIKTLAIDPSPRVRTRSKV
jgi:DNA-binding NtrC family response regulator